MGPAMLCSPGPLLCGLWAGPGCDPCTHGFSYCSRGGQGTTGFLAGMPLWEGKRSSCLCGVSPEQGHGLLGLGEASQQKGARWAPMPKLSERDWLIRSRHTE